MNLEEQVCSLELAKELDRLGVKVPSHFYWNAKDENIDAFWLTSNPYEGYSKYPAYSVAELGGMLPEDMVQTLKWKGLWYCESWKDVVDKINPICRKVDETEANARAKMLIYLITNKLMEVPKWTEKQQ